MSLFTVLRILSAAFVLFALAMTATLAYHVQVRPVDGPFSRLLPQPASVDPHEQAVLFARSLESRSIPDIEPGEQAYRKAREMMAAGRMDEAKVKLTTIFNIFPNSSVARDARRIVGNMNIDRILGSTRPVGSLVHRVQPGDSYLAIAAKHATSIDMMVHLNSMTRLRGIQPGDELLVLPLHLGILIEPRRQAVSLWDGGTFLCDYPALSMTGVPKRPGKTTIERKVAERDGGHVPPHDEWYSTADKTLLLANPQIQIRAWDGQLAEDEEIPHGILLKPEDMEELSLLTRPGNAVEFR